MLYLPNMMALAQVSAMTVDPIGVEHVTFQQSYEAVPVFGGQVKLHYNPTKQFRTVSGKPAADISVDTTPTLSAEVAGTMAQDLAGQTAAVKKSTLYIFNEYLLNKHKPDAAVLVWEIELYQPRPLLHEFYYINAHTGELVYQMHGVHDAISRLIYDCSYADGNCYYDTADPLTGYIYGRSEGQAARGPNPKSYVTKRTDTDNLYDLLGSIQDYYSAKFGRDGANQLGGMGDGVFYPAASTIGLTYLDYYFNSVDDYTSCPNAFFDGIGTIRFCEGFVTNDIAGHEYGHAVNYFSVLDSTGAPAGLAYAYEIGALNEANSDVFGEALEYYRTGSNDWLMGNELSTGALRSMSDPTVYSYVDDLGASVAYPDRYMSPNLYCGEGDSGGVHYNSSVVNKAAYLIAIGGTFNGCTIAGLGRDKEEAIFYRAQSTYYTTTTDFNGAYIALLAACADLYSTTDCKEVEKALRAVELNQAGYCSGEVAVDPGCAAVDAVPTVVAATSTVANGSYKAGAALDILVTFSEAVSGDVTVLLETGANDGSCSFTLAAETSGTCTYTVRAGDASSDLTVQAIIGTITDGSGDMILDTTPATNLAAAKNIIIDTAAPAVPTKLKIYTSQRKHKRLKTINPQTFTKVVRAKSLHPYFTWPAVPDATRYYVTFTDKTITRKKILKLKHKRLQPNQSGTVRHPGKKYSLYMLLQDGAGNRSKVRKLLTYKPL